MCQSLDSQKSFNSLGNLSLPQLLQGGYGYPRKWINEGVDVKKSASSWSRKRIKISKRIRDFFRLIHVGGWISFVFWFICLAKWISFIHSGALHLSITSGKQSLLGAFDKCSFRFYRWFSLQQTKQVSSKLEIATTSLGPVGIFMGICGYIYLKHAPIGRFLF